VGYNSAECEIITLSALQKLYSLFPTCASPPFGPPLGDIPVTSENSTECDITAWNASDNSRECDITARNAR